MCSYLPLCLSPSPRGLPKGRKVIMGRSSGCLLHHKEDGADNCTISPGLLYFKFFGLGRTERFVALAALATTLSDPFLKPATLFRPPGIFGQGKLSNRSASISTASSAMVFMPRLFRLPYSRISLRNGV